MPNKITSESALFTSFQQQISRSKLDQFLSGIENKNSGSAPNYLAFSISLSPVDLLAVVEQDHLKNSFQYYWEKPVDDFAMAASGEMERLTAHGESRFRDSSKKGKEVLSRIHHLKGIKHQNAVVHLFGGFSFFDENNSDSWSSFDSSSFTLPEWMIIREGKCCILTFLINYDQASSISEIESEISNKLAELDHITNADQYSLNPVLDQGFSINGPPASLAAGAEVLRGM